MSEPVVIQSTVEVNPTENTIEYSAERWAAMTPLERGLALDDAVDTEIGNAGGAGWQIVSGTASVDDVEIPPTRQALLDEIEQLRSLAGHALDGIHHYHAPIPVRECRAPICVDLLAARDGDL